MKETQGLKIHPEKNYNAILVINVTVHKIQNELLKRLNNSIIALTNNQKKIGSFNT